MCFQMMMSKRDRQCQADPKQANRSVAAMQRRHNDDRSSVTLEEQERGVRWSEGAEFGRLGHAVA